MNLEEIEARLAAATPGPWAWASAPAEGSSETPAEYVANALTGDGPLFVVWVPSTEGAAGGYVLTAVTGDGPHASFDAEFIGHAPEDIRGLLAEVKRLQAQIEAVKKIHKPYSDPSEPEDGPWCEYGDVWKWADDGEDICDECEKTFAVLFVSDFMENELLPSINGVCLQKKAGGWPEVKLKQYGEQVINETLAGIQEALNECGCDLRILSMRLDV